MGAKQNVSYPATGLAFGYELLELRKIGAIQKSLFLEPFWHCSEEAADPGREAKVSSLSYQPQVAQALLAVSEPPSEVR